MYSGDVEITVVIIVEDACVLLYVHAVELMMKSADEIVVSRRSANEGNMRTPPLQQLSSSLSYCTRVTRQISFVSASRAISSSSSRSTDDSCSL